LIFSGIQLIFAFFSSQKSCGTIIAAFLVAFSRKKMKLTGFILLSLFFINSLAYGQETSAMDRSPEQEAAKQTEKLQAELNLTPEQVKKVQEINLKYARERQISNTRSAAMQRIKDKDSDLKRVLTSEQYIQLQNKRYERSSFQNLNQNPNIPANASGFRQEGSSRSSTNEPTRTRTSTTGTTTRQPAASNERSTGNSSRYYQRTPRTTRSSSQPSTNTRTRESGSQNSGSRRESSTSSPTRGNSSDTSTRSSSNPASSSSPSRQSSTSSGGERSSSSSSNSGRR